jgi:hypothetical protein
MPSRGLGRRQAQVLRVDLHDGLTIFDRGDGIAIEGEKQLADFISKIGRRSPNRVKSRSSAQ